ncbi:hypothetical protein RB595_010463 [Gaeumannomyces hyphopodioides]
MEDLNRAIEVTGMAVDATPQNHPDRASYLSNLGNRLGSRFERTGSMEDLNRAVEIAGMAVNATPQNHPNQAGHLNNLGNKLGRRFERTGSMDDLNRAVEVASMAVDATPQNHPNRAACLNTLGNWLSSRFKRTGLMGDLNRAVEAADMAVDATPQNHPNRAGRLNNLGVMLGMRFQRTGSTNDLNRAVEVIGMAVDATPQNHPNRAVYLNNLGTWLGRRFEQTGSMNDLNRAVEVAGMAVDATPQNHPDRIGRLSNLGNRLGSRFKRTGSMNDLNRAVEVANMAVDATPQNHPDRAGHLNNLGNRLGSRFERTGLMDDLNRAVEVTGMAVDATPQNHPDRIGRLNNLGNRLGRRFEWTGSMDDLNRAVEAAGMAVDAIPQNHTDRASCLDTLGNWLSSRFKRTGLMDDLNRAVEAAGMAVDATPQNHRNRTAYLNNLGNWLGRRFERTGSTNDLNRAVEIIGIAVDATPRNHPDRAAYLDNFGIWLGRRFEQTGSTDDLNRSLSLYKEGWSCHTAPPPIRIRLARSAANILASQRNWDESSQLLQEAVKLLPIHSSLADEFIALRDELDSPADRPTFAVSSDDTSSWESQAKRRREADQKFSELTTSIRAQPGFDGFLRPPAAGDLMAAADPSPIIIINLSPYRCDAFLVERDRIRVLELPGLTMEEVQKRCQALRSAALSPPPMPEWLWDAAARPGLDALGFKDPVSDNNWPRVWWIPTGILSQLPLHAAGKHVRGSTETVLDRVMSSYAPSVKALIHGRQHHVRGHHVRDPAGHPSGHALLVAMRQTPGLATNGILPYAADEVKRLNDLCPSLHLAPIEPERRKDDVLTRLEGCTVFHFAGHGRSDPVEPSRSCLLLEDWETNPLTVGDLRDHRFKNHPPFLGYLSACSTGANEAERLADEGIHLVSALQLAGFRHVVGTLWEVSDRYCVDVARVLYETLRDQGMTDMAVCQGLHRAIRALRDGRIGREQDARIAEVVSVRAPEVGLTNPHWVPYVHFGV